MIADGATSKLAMKMGYCTEPPRGICSRAFVEGGTHNTDYDGELLPAQWVRQRALPPWSCSWRSKASATSIKVLGPQAAPPTSLTNAVSSSAASFRLGLFVQGRPMQLSSHNACLQVCAFISESLSRGTQPSSGIPTMS